MDIEIIGRGDNFLLVRKDGREFVSFEYKQSGRIAYMFDTFVVKFGGGSAGWKELNFYNLTLEPEDKKYFAAIFGGGVFRGKDYIIQERVFTDKKEACNPTEEDAKIIRRLKDEYGVCDIILLDKERAECETHYHEIHHNISINRNHEIKIFDYSR